MKTKINIKKLVLLTASTLFLSGCFATTPKYQGDMSGVSPITVKINDGKLDMGLPDGWKPGKTAHHASNWAAEVQQTYEKKVSGGAAILTTLCFTAFLSKDGLAETMRSSLRSVDTNAVKTLGPNQLDTPSFFDPEFEVYNINVVASGMKVPFASMIGWKLDSSISGCKYGMFMLSPRQDKAAMLNDFLAILGSLE